MISNQFFSYYPFFNGLGKDHINYLMDVAHEVTLEQGKYFFREGDELNNFYLVGEGDVAIVIGVTDHDKEQNFVDHIFGKLNTRDITICTLGKGEMFGWSALVPPHYSTASAKASTISRVVVFDCKKLRRIFENDYRFAYLMMNKAAQTIRERLRAMRIENLESVMVLAGMQS